MRWTAREKAEWDRITAAVTTEKSDLKSRKKVRQMKGVNLEEEQTHRSRQEKLESET